MCMMLPKAMHDRENLDGFLCSQSIPLQQFMTFTKTMHDRGFSLYGRIYGDCIIVQQMHDT
jgi:hypothetical protein